MERVRAGVAELSSFAAAVPEVLGAGRSQANSSRHPGSWFRPRKSGFRWEQEGLDHLRALMPRTELFRAWATFIVLGRVAPFGIGAVIGGGPNATLAALAVRAGRRASRVVDRLTPDERR